MTNSYRAKVCDKVDNAMLDAHARFRKVTPLDVKFDHVLHIGRAAWNRLKHEAAHEAWTYTKLGHGHEMPTYRGMTVMPAGEDFDIWVLPAGVSPAEHAAKVNKTAAPPPSKPPKPYA